MSNFSWDGIVTKRFFLSLFSHQFTLIKRAVGTVQAYTILIVLIYFYKVPIFSTLFFFMILANLGPSFNSSNFACSLYLV